MSFVNDRMEEQYFVEPTPKDFGFYAPFFKKSLEGKLRQNEKWLKITEIQMDNIENPTTEIYEEQKKRIERYKENIQKISEKLNLDMNESNQEFFEYVKEQLYYKEKQRVCSIKKKNAVQNAKKSMQESMNKKYTEDRAYRRQENYQKRSIDSSYSRVLDIEQSLPPYIKNALEKLPNHKGYIFRGIWYFGKQPSHEKNFMSMMDRNLIHEYYFDGRGYKYYKCFEKSNNGKRELINERVIYNSKYIF